VSVQATTWVWDHSKAQGAGLLVLLAIADAANKEGAESMQSVPTIARMARTTERHVARCIVKLVEMGELERTGKSSRYGTTVYRLPKMGAEPQYGGEQWRSWLDPAGEPPLTSGQGGQDVRGDIGERDPLTFEPSTPDPQVTQPHKDTPEHPTPSAGEHAPVSSADADGEKLTEEAIDMAFEAWWVRVPRKVGKKAARKAYGKAIREVGRTVLDAGLDAHLPYWEGKSQEHIPHPSTWLNEGRWEDRPEVPTSDDGSSVPTEDPNDWMKRRGEG